MLWARSVPFERVEHQTCPPCSQNRDRSNSPRPDPQAAPAAAGEPDHLRWHFGSGGGGWLANMEVVATVEPPATQQVPAERSAAIGSGGTGGQIWTAALHVTAHDDEESDGTADGPSRAALACPASGAGGFDCEERRMRPHFTFAHAQQNVPDQDRAPCPRPPAASPRVPRAAPASGGTHPVERHLPGRRGYWCSGLAAVALTVVWRRSSPSPVAPPSAAATGSRRVAAEPGGSKTRARKWSIAPSASC